MASVLDQVIEAFRYGHYARHGHFVSTGDALYSYSLKLAGRGIGGIYLTTAVDEPQAPPTNRHRLAVKRVFEGNGAIVARQNS